MHWSAEGDGEVDGEGLGAEVGSSQKIALECGENIWAIVRVHGNEEPSMQFGMAVEVSIRELTGG